MVNLAEKILLDTKLSSEQLQAVEKVQEYRRYLEIFYEDIQIIAAGTGEEAVSSDSQVRQLPFEFGENPGTVKVRLVEKGNPAPGLADLAEYVAGAGCLNYPESFLVPDGLIVTDASGQKVFTNHVAAGMWQRLGIEGNSLAAMLQRLEVRNPHVYRCLEEPAFFGENLQYKQFELALIINPLFSGGEFKGTMIILSDLTLLKKKEKELIKKATVIKEIHHRVKNNLQTITSLLRLQMRRIKSDKVEKALNESINRILSISLIHEVLSHQELEIINIKQTLYRILDMIMTNMVPSNKVIRGEILGEDVYLTPQEANSLALCTTELIQNAIEHAFAKKTEGLIRITVQTKDGELYVTVQDNGAGIATESIQNKGSLGMQIVETMTRDALNGRFFIEGSKAGTVATIAFKPDIKEGGESE